MDAYFKQTDLDTRMIASLIGCKPDTGLLLDLNDLLAMGRIRRVGMTIGQILDVWLAYQIEKNRPRPTALATNA